MLVAFVSHSLSPLKMKRLETPFKLSKDKLSYKFMKMRKHLQLCVEVIYRIFIQEIGGILVLNAENMIQVGHIIVGWRNKRLPVKKRASAFENDKK